MLDTAGADRPCALMSFIAIFIASATAPFCSQHRNLDRPQWSGGVCCQALRRARAVRKSLLKDMLRRRRIAAV
jgi:hypothetical protein